MPCDVLTSIGLKYNTDKAFFHKFTELYDMILNTRKDNIKNMLEIGIAMGSSLKMWNEYLPNTTICAMDIDLSGDPHLPNVHCIYADQNNNESLKTALLNLPAKNYDFIIDDGGHRSSQQRRTLQIMWSQLNSGGIYIIEDLHTNIPEWFPLNIGYCDESVPIYYDILAYLSGKEFNLPIDVSSVEKIILYSNPKTHSITGVFFKEH